MFKLLGITDEITTCDCCGRSNLKCTVALENEAGEIVHYGRDCAGKALYGRKSAKNTDLVTERARMIEKCKAVLPRVLEGVAAGKTAEEVRKAIGYNFSVHFGRYCDTGNKMPLRVYWNGWSVPGVEIAANAY